MDPTPKYEPSRKGVFWLDLKSCGETGDSLLRKSFVMHQANPAAKMTFLIDTPLSPGLGVHVPRGPHTSKHSSWLPALVDCVPCRFRSWLRAKTAGTYPISAGIHEEAARRQASKPMCGALYTNAKSYRRRRSSGPHSRRRRRRRILALVIVVDSSRVLTLVVVVVVVDVVVVGSRPSRDSTCVRYLHRPLSLGRPRPSRRSQRPNQF